jgi:hypothetical protein
VAQKRVKTTTNLVKIYTTASNLPRGNKIVPLGPNLTHRAVRDLDARQPPKVTAFRAKNFWHLLESLGDLLGNRPLTGPNPAQNARQSRLEPVWATVSTRRAFCLARRASGPNSGAGILGSKTGGKCPSWASLESGGSARSSGGCAREQKLAGVWNEEQ